MEEIAAGISNADHDLQHCRRNRRHEYHARFGTGKNTGNRNPNVFWSNDQANFVSIFRRAMTLALFGGFHRMLFGTGAVSLVSYFSGLPSLVSLPVIIGGILFSKLNVVIIGVLPANKAKAATIES